MSITKNVLLSKLVLFNEKKIAKDSDESNFGNFDTPHYTNSQDSTVSFGYVDFEAKIFLFLYPRSKMQQPVLPYLMLAYVF